MKTKIKIFAFLQFASLLTFGQVAGTKFFHSKDGLCSTSFLLDSLGNFYWEGGCEGRSYISFGTYTINNDKIDFNYKSFDNLSPILEIKEDSVSNDTSITVTFLTRYGQPVHKRNFSFDAIDTSNQQLQTFNINDNGQAKINFEKFGVIKLTSLENILSKNVSIPLRNRNMTIVLNAPQLFFHYERPTPLTGKNSSLLLKSDGLYNLTGQEKIFSIDK